MDCIKIFTNGIIISYGFDHLSNTLGYIYISSMLIISFY